MRIGRANQENIGPESIEFRDSARGGLDESKVATDLRIHRSAEQVLFKKIIWFLPNGAGARAAP
jgi:hypothetical protein